MNDTATKKPSKAEEIKGTVSVKPTDGHLFTVLSKIRASEGSYSRSMTALLLMAAKEGLKTGLVQQRLSEMALAIPDLIPVINQLLGDDSLKPTFVRELPPRVDNSRALIYAGKSELLVKPQDQPKPVAFEEIDSAKMSRLEVGEVYISEQASPSIEASPQATPVQVQPIVQDVSDQRVASGSAAVTRKPFLPQLG